MQGYSNPSEQILCVEGFVLIFKFCAAEKIFPHAIFAQLLLAFYNKEVSAH